MLDIDGLPLKTRVDEILNRRPAVGFALGADWSTWMRPPTATCARTSWRPRRPAGDLQPCGPC
jgi:hypothetical protein